MKTSQNDAATCRSELMAVCVRGLVMFQLGSCNLVSALLNIVKRKCGNGTGLLTAKCSRHPGKN